MKYIFTCFLLLFTSLVFGQDIQGVWEGNYGWTFMVTRPQKLVVELQLYNDSLLTGASHLYYGHNKYEHYKLKGVMHKDSTVSFLEDSTISVRLGWGVDNCLGWYKMKFTIITDTLLRLEGRWKDKNRGLFHCPSSSVWLVKRIPKVDTIQPAPAVARDTAKEIALLDAKKLQRATDIQSLLEVTPDEKDSIKIEVYDNGVIDNDSVSVYYDDQPLIRNQMISLKPITFYVSLDKGTPIRKIKMTAESMGSIPPCTAVMIVTTKRKRYEVNLSSDFSKNATIELFLKE